MRTGCSVRPQSSTSGSGRSRNCVSTVPTEPAAVFDAGVAMRGIISGVSRRPACRCMIRAFREVRIASKGFTMAMTSVNNGVNVQALLDAREVWKDELEAARVSCRVDCKAENGTYSTTELEGFVGVGQAQSHATEPSFDADQPEIFSSEDRGITALEYVLVGLASCLPAGVAAVAHK